MSNQTQTQTNPITIKVKTPVKKIKVKKLKIVEPEERKPLGLTYCLGSFSGDRENYEQGDAGTFSDLDSLFEAIKTDLQQDGDYGCVKISRVGKIEIWLEDFDKDDEIEFKPLNSIPNGVRDYGDRWIDANGLGLMAIKKVIQPIKCDYCGVRNGKEDCGCCH